jgi:hypothetical protein
MIRILARLTATFVRIGLLPVIFSGHVPVFFLRRRPEIFQEPV